VEDVMLAFKIANRARMTGRSINSIKTGASI